MNFNTNAIVDSVKASMLNLRELVEQATRGQSADEIERLKSEVQQTVFMMIAAIVLADAKYADGERAFVNLLVDWSKRPGGEMRYLTEYAEAWKTACANVPDFFQAGVVHDGRFNTELAQGMMREIELIGNNTCVSDGQFEAVEHEVVRKYMLLLEGFLRAQKTQHKALRGNNADGWTSI